MPARARRSVAPEEDPRIRRQELSHGVYNFKSVWGYYKKLGWTTRPGGELGYDHYYIKPGKNTKRDVEGEDFFYGEAAIVAYGMKGKIFGEVPTKQQFSQQVPRMSTPRRGSSVASTKRGSVSGSTCNSDSDDDSASASASASCSIKRRVTTTTRKRLKQATQWRSSSSSSQQKQKRRRWPGGHALDAISITSGSVGSGDDSKSTSTMDLESSDDDESDTDFRVDGVDEEEEDDDDDDSDDDSDGDSDADEFDIDSEEDSNEDDIVVVNVGVLASKLKGNFQAKKREPRPLLSTNKRKAGDSKSGLKQEDSTNKKSAKRSRPHSSGAGTSGRGMKYEPKHSGRPSQSVSASKPSAPTSASSGKSKRKPAEPRRLSVETEAPSQTPSASQSTSQTTTSSAAPARTAPAPTRVSSAPPSLRHSFLSPSTLPQSTESSRRQREVTPSTQRSQIYVESSGEVAPVETDTMSYEPDPPDYDDHSFEQSAPPVAETNSTRVNSHPSPASSASYPAVKTLPAHHRPTRTTPEAAREDPTPPSSTTTSTAVPSANSPVIVHLQLDEVLFPSQSNQTFRVKITSTESPKQTTIGIEHVQTREQRECTFSDIRQLDGKMTHEIPEKAIFEALLRCLRSQKSASVTAPGAEAQREKFSSEELGKVDLLQVDSDALCLQLMFPCYEFWKQKHRFMMKLVPAQARLKALVRELEEVRRELVMTQERLDSALSRNQLIETECDQLRTLLRAYQEKEQAHQRLEELHQQQQRRQELIKEAQEAKPAAVAPAQEEHLVSPRRPPSATRKRDTRSFHARSGWLVSSNASATLQASPEKSISWESIVETTDKYFQIVDESNRVVQILQTGTYQLNLNVTHESSMGLGVWIRSFDAVLNAEKVRKLEPTLVQFYDNKQRVSRLDQVVELSRYDQVSVHLTELGELEIRTIWMAHFAPQPNMFFLTFLDQELVYKEAGK